MMKRITILTKSPQSKNNPNISYFGIKNYFKNLIHNIKNNIQQKRTINGPDSVLANLNKGLRSIREKNNLNPTFYSVNPNVGVLSDINALIWAINAKENQKIIKLIAGPNLVVLPSDNNSILCSERIDIVVTPCKWVSDLYCFIAPQLKSRIKEWPVGIDTEYWKPSTGSTRNEWILYDKSEYGGKEIVLLVESELVSRGIKYQKIVYGSYSPEEYKKLLNKASAMIVVSPSESQGLAQFEAWSCNVPTLIWDRGFWKSNDGSFEWIGASSSPYLSVSCGKKFIDSNDFSNKLDEFIDQLISYTPRDYILRNFTLEICAKKYVDLFIN